MSDRGDAYPTGVLGVLLAVSIKGGGGELSSAAHWPAQPMFSGHLGPPLDKSIRSGADQMHAGGRIPSGPLS